MDNQEVNIWLIKRMQTESTLRSEERRLENAKSEYNSERNKYQNARETFQSTKIRLMSGDRNKNTPQTTLEHARTESFKLKDDKTKLQSIHDRLSLIESKVKKHVVVVLQNKKKLEVLQEKINFLYAQKSAKKNFKEELEVLDSRIQQMVVCSQKNKDIRKNENSEKSELDDFILIEEFVPFEITDKTPDSSVPDQNLLNSENATGNFGQNNRQHFQQQQQQQHTEISQSNDAAHDNQKYYEQIQNLSYLRNDEVDHLNLRYFNKSGHAFELQIRKQFDQGYIIEIKPHSRVDSINLNLGKNEIIESLKGKGLKLNKITVRDYSHV